MTPLPPRVEALWGFEPFDVLCILLCRFWDDDDLLWRCRTACDRLLCRCCYLRLSMRKDTARPPWDTKSQKGTVVNSLRRRGREHPRSAPCRLGFTVD